MKTWNRGRLGICEEGNSKQLTFSICPSTKEILEKYCNENGYLKSQVINLAIKYYIKNENKKIKVRKDKIYS